MEKCSSKTIQPTFDIFYGEVANIRIDYKQHHCLLMQYHKKKRIMADWNHRLFDILLDKDDKYIIYSTEREYAKLDTFEHLDDINEIIGRTEFVIDDMDFDKTRHICGYWIVPYKDKDTLYFDSSGLLVRHISGELVINYMLTDEDNSGYINISKTYTKVALRSS